MIFHVVYHPHVVQSDIPKLSPMWREKIRHAIEHKLTTNPATFGKPLRKSLRGYRKLRVSDYRVIFRIEKQQVLVLMIAHRSRIYKDIDKRT